MSDQLEDGSKEVTVSKATDFERTSSPSAEGDGAQSASGRSIGPYRLVRILGQGGMGQVWLAEQTAPIQRQVALKLIRVGIYDDAVLLRFRAERQALAMMEHPSIAKVFDAGATPDGQPYFVMEYVPGEPITVYCDEKKLDIRSRLELFVQVCDGVQHAHQKAIIHRDLKPANILVVDVDEKATPRIIDFGLAKAVVAEESGEGSAATMFTQAGEFLGTPGFMSPEQAGSDGVDVDTRTDVYSLGVVLYVLLTGVLPFENRQRGKTPVPEMLRQIREEDPPTPSKKLTTGWDTLSAAAGVRGIEPKQLVSALRGDLDWITIKALERDRNRRYGSPVELAADIGRYLRNEPIEARPASTGYRMRKYVRRHRVGVGIAAGLVLLLVAFGVTQAVQLRRITRERDRADRVTEYITQMFKVSDPSEAQGNTITARSILDKASKQIDSGLTQDPELRAQLMRTMGEVYGSLGLYQEQRRLLDRALSIEMPLLGPKSRETLRTQQGIAMSEIAQGKYSDAHELLKQVQANQASALGQNDPDTLTSTYHKALALDGLAKYPEAEQTYRSVLDAQRRVLGPDDARTLQTQCDLGSTLDSEGKYEESDKVEHDAVDRLTRTLGEDHPSTMRATANLAGILSDEGKFAEAERLYRDNLARRERVLGAKDSETISTIGNLAMTVAQEGKLSESEALQREAFELENEVLGPEHINTFALGNNLASTLILEGRFHDAEILLRPIALAVPRVLGPDHPLTAEAIGNLAVALMKQGQLSQAEALLRNSLKVQEPAFARNEPSAATTAYSLACVLAQEHRPDEAISYLSAALDHGLPPNISGALAQDPDLKMLRGDPRFTEILAKVSAAPK